MLRETKCIIQELLLVQAREEKRIKEVKDNCKTKKVATEVSQGRTKNS